jgi:hypothetical protein
LPLLQSTPTSDELVVYLGFSETPPQVWSFTNIALRTQENTVCFPVYHTSYNSGIKEEEYSFHITLPEHPPVFSNLEVKPKENLNKPSRLT